MLTFHEMETKFGVASAWYCLLEIEKAARIASWTVAALDPEIRLANACRTQDSLQMQDSLAQAA